MKNIICTLGILALLGSCGKTQTKGNGLDTHKPGKELQWLSDAEIKKQVEYYEEQRGGNGYRVDSILEIKRRNDSVFVSFLNNLTWSESDSEKVKDEKYWNRFTEDHFLQLRLRMIIKNNGAYIKDEPMDTLTTPYVPAFNKPDSSSYVAFNDTDSVMIANYSYNSDPIPMMKKINGKVTGYIKAPGKTFYVDEICTRQMEWEDSETYVHVKGNGKQKGYWLPLEDVSWSHNSSEVAGYYSTDYHRVYLLEK
ncbi:MAG TPA: hypothetical protein VI112_10120 [Bacteroidia bacterium]|jgi:hypothetical protein